MPLVSDRSEHVFAGNARFELKRELGRGGFGVVFEVFDHVMGVPVALKALRRLEPVAVHRFKDEFRSLTDVSHPHLIHLYELHADGDHWFFTMELVDGQRITRYVRGEDHAADEMSTLDAEPQSSPDSEDDGTLATASASLRTFEVAAGADKDDQSVRGLFPVPTHPVPAPPIDLYRLRDAFTQLAEGVSAVHSQGVLHRDLKPSNVLVGTDGRVIILDFGLVKSLSSAAIVSHFLEGTPDYMSPEQGRDTGLTEPSDWYSVGVMLFECLTGRLPYAGKALSIVNARAHYDAPPPSTLVSTIPPDLDRLCHDLMKRKPGDRPSGEEVIDRLKSSQARTGRARRDVEALRLVGRGSHLAALAEAYRAVESGRTVVVSVHGASGIGKSVLVHTALERLGQTKPKLLTLVGRCYERESVPYKAFDSVVDALTDHLKSLSQAEVDRLLPPTRDVQALARLFEIDVS